MLDVKFLHPLKCYCVGFVQAYSKPSENKSRVCLSDYETYTGGI